MGPIYGGGVGCWALAIHFSPFVRRGPACVQEKTKVGWGRWFWPAGGGDISCQRRMQMLAKDCTDSQIWGISLVLTERRQKYPSSRQHCRLSLWQYDWLGEKHNWTPKNIRKEDPNNYFDILTLIQQDSSMSLIFTFLSLLSPWSYDNWYKAKLFKS